MWAQRRRRRIPRPTSSGSSTCGDDAVSAPQQRGRAVFQLGRTRIFTFPRRETAPRIAKIALPRAVVLSASGEHRYERCRCREQRRAALRCAATRPRAAAARRLHGRHRRQTSTGHCQPPRFWQDELGAWHRAKHLPASSRISPTHPGAGVIIFELEMPADQIASRASAWTQVSRSQE